jgi:alanine-glyoxylate transaminase / serine-glyoxylate transaminase / serine-pyruvate transaminase
MKNTKNKLNEIRDTLLMGPGPSYVPPEVYAALAKPTIGHLDPCFIGIMDAIKGQLQQVFGTKNDLTLPVSGTGSAGMEAVFVNLVEPGDSVLVLVNGVFGKRMLDVAGRLGAEADSVDFSWGTPVIPEEVEQRLKQKNYKILAMVHAETSTGVLNPAAEVGRLAKEHGALYILDTVTSLGGIEVASDRWGVDAVYSGTQKCLSCPPGLAPVSFSQAAVEVLSHRRKKVPNWYLDMNLIAGYWGGGKRAYHHTAPVNMNYALYQALELLLDEGLETVFERHRQAHELLVTGMQKLGLRMLVEKEYRLPMLNAVYIPEGIDDAEARALLLNRHAIEIGSGLGDFAGKVWRIGLMGHTARPRYVERFLSALESLIGAS